MSNNQGLIKPVLSSYSLTIGKFEYPDSTLYS